MSIRHYAPSDYSSIKSWWTAHGWQPIPEALLPATGYIVPQLCAGFLYKTDSRFCVLEWIIANPESGHEERSAALDAVLNSLINEAKRLGFSVIFTTSDSARLIARYQKHGFQVTDTGVTHLIRSL